MCGGFTCSKNTLVGLNVVYVLVSFLLIGVAVHGRASGIITSLPIVGGITACGIFLLIISVVGVVGAVKHHQVLLFFYMIVLFLIFLIQFSVSVAALSVKDEDQKTIIQAAWNNAANSTKFDAEKAFHCCGLNNFTEGVECSKIPDCKGTPMGCPTCMQRIQDKTQAAFSVAGGLGLFFSFTEFVGGIIAFRYRNLMDPFATGAAGAAFSSGM